MPPRLHILEDTTLPRQRNDPRDLGARCSECVLGGRRREIGITTEWRPVCSELRPTRDFAVGEAPGQNEVEAQLPWIGAAGAELMSALASVGKSRHELSFGNTINCLTYESSVVLGDGSTRVIGKLFADRYAGEVRTVIDGKPAVARVTGWHKSLRGDRRLFKLTTRYARSRGSKTVGPVITEDHEVLTARGWVPVVQLSPSDRVATRDLALDARGAAVITGSLLGDGTLPLKSAAFQTSHVATNRDYSLLLARVLSGLGPRVTDVDFPSVRRNGGKPQVMVRVPATGWLGELRNRWYGHRRPKRVPRDIALSPLAIAVWFLDDGYLSLRSLRMPRSEFATCGFGQDDVAYLCSLLSPFGVEGRPTWHVHSEARNGQGGYWRLSMGPIATERLATLIAPYIPASMQYKLPEFHRGKFDERLWAPAGVVAYFDQPIVQEVHPSRLANAKWVYCLSVDGPESFATTTAVVHNCQPPGNRFDRMTRKIDARNREIKRETPHGVEPDYLISPVEACRPRLIAEALRYQNLILLGGKALRAFATGNVMERHGGATKVGLLVDGATTIELDDGEAWPALQRVWKAMPLLHPSFVMQTKRYRGFFKTGIGRAFRFFEDRMAWRKPIVIRDKIRVTAAAIRNYHASRVGSFVEIDIETNYHPPPPSALFDDPFTVSKKRQNKVSEKNYCRLQGECSRGCVRQTFLEQKIRCIGIGDPDMGFVVALLGIDGETKFYSPHEEKEIIDALRDLWVDPRVLKTFHNGVWAEILACARPEYFDCEPVNYRDTMLDAQLVDSEMPLNLQTRVLLFEDAPAWKGDTRTNPGSDSALHEYNAEDVVLGARLAVHQWPIVRARRQEQLVEHSHRVAGMCSDMHRLGLRIDQKCRARWEIQLRNEIEKWTERARELTGKSDFNPNSAPQCSKLLFDEMGFTPVDGKVSDKTGIPSADDDVLIEIYGKQLAKGDPRRDIIRAIRFTRKPKKMFGTYCKPLRPRWMEGGWVWEDGRLHAEARAAGTKSGRISMGDPVSPQTFPSAAPYNMRSMIVPHPGHVFVSCDLDQAELRSVAAQSGCTNYLEVFRKKWDPHGLMSETAFKHRYTGDAGYADPRTGKKPKKGSVAERLRVNTKTVVFSSTYGAFVPTVHARVVCAEDERGELIFADADMAETALIHKAWIEDFAPEIPRWWKSITDFWKREGFVAEPVLGRRRDFLDSSGWRDNNDDYEIESSELYNHPVQGSIASLCALILERIAPRFPLNFAGPFTGIVLQTHDSYMVEVPIAIAEECRVFLEQAMTISHPSLPGVDFTCESDISARYGPVKCPYCQGDIDAVMEQFGAKVCKCGYAADLEKAA